MLEYHAAVQAVVLELVGHPGVRVAHAAERVELHARVHVHVIEVYRGLERYLVTGQALRVVDLVPAGVLHQQVHRRLEGLKFGHLLKHPREHGLAGKHERACEGVELGTMGFLFCCGPANGHGVAVGVDELLQCPVQRVRARIGALESAHQKAVGYRGAAAQRAVTINKRVVDNPVHALKARLHAKVAAHELQALDRHRRTVGQCGFLHLDRIGQRRHALDIGGVAVVILLGLGRHARESVRVDLAGARRHVRNAAAGKACRHALREEGQITQRQKSAVALADRDPGLAAKAHQTQVLKIAHDGAGEVTLEKVCLRAGRIGAGCLRALAQGCDRASVNTAAASGAALVGQHDTEMLDGLLDPAVAGGRQRTRALAAGAALQKQEQRQIVVDAVGCADHAVEKLDALGRAGDGRRHGAAAHGAADGQKHWLKAAPVERDIDAVVLDIQAGDVVRSDERHVMLPFVAVFRVDQFYRRRRGCA